MKNFRAKVPGKIMLAGEYAVLQGGRSLSVAVDRWLEAQASSSREVEVHSDLWNHSRTLDDSDEPLLQVASAAKALWFGDGQGFSLTVRSQLDISLGLGSSTALRLATLMALAKLADQDLSLENAGRMVRELQLQQQSFASGYDVLTQMRGGLILWSPDYSSWPGHTKAYPVSALEGWVHVYGGGQGAPTALQGRSVRQWLSETRRESTLQILSEALIDGFLELIRQGWAAGKEDFLERLIPHRRFFQGSPGFPVELSQRLAALPGFDRSWSFKTTGAGGEDALLLFGTEADCRAAHEALSSQGWHRLNLDFTDSGACYEDISS